MLENIFLKLLNINSLKSILVFIHGQSSNQRSSLEKGLISHALVTLNPCPPPSNPGTVSDLAGI